MRGGTLSCFAACLHFPQLVLSIWLVYLKVQIKAELFGKSGSWFEEKHLKRFWFFQPKEVNVKLYPDKQSPSINVSLTGTFLDSCNICSSSFKSSLLSIWKCHGIKFTTFFSFTVPLTVNAAALRSQLIWHYIIWYLLWQWK